MESINRTVRFFEVTKYEVHKSYKGESKCSGDDRDIVERIKTRIAVTQEVGQLDNIGGKLKLSSGNEIPIAFGEDADPCEGTYIWFQPEKPCPSSVTRLYYGSVNVALNRTTTMVGGLMIMERNEGRK